MVRETHQLSFCSDRFLPDKAIDLIDEAGSRVRLRHAQVLFTPAMFLTCCYCLPFVNQVVYGFCSFLRRLENLTKSSGRSPRKKMRQFVVRISRRYICLLNLMDIVEILKANIWILED